MNDAHDPIAPFRGRLLGLAYRMLGSHVDAEDVLQDAFLRIHGATGIENREAYLMTTVTRLCLDTLKSARVRREAYVGSWLPEPVLDAEALSPDTALELADDLSFALMLVLERLSPFERAAFLLHDVFDLKFSEISEVLGKSVANCRQLASRARRTVKAEHSVARVTLERQRKLAEAFASAVASGNLGELSALLREDAVLLSDGGGQKMSALNPIRGADRVARFFVGVAQKFGGANAGLRHEWRVVNGAIGLVSYIGEEPEQVMSLCIEQEAIAAIYMVRNPEKLGQLAIGR